MRNPPIIDVGDVTLVTVTGVEADAAQRALQRCLNGLRFRRALMISSDLPTRPDNRIEHVAIGSMSLADYSRFILYELHRHIDTSHVLIVQADGYVLNPERWTTGWLEFDYIGAPWPPIRQVGKMLVPWPNRVGNGGFSLRSRKLLQLVAEHPGPHDHSRPEDVFTCVDLLEWLREHDIRFPSPYEAARFSIEHPEAVFGQTVGTAFGFHGEHFLRRSRNPLHRLFRRK